MGKQLKPYDAFKVNIRDAQALIIYARAFRNNRNRAMRQELRSKVGGALKVSIKQQKDLDCLESNDLFVVFKPSGNLGRAQFEDLQPLLRQSLVAACAALETYIADRAMDFVGSTLKSESLPSRMQSINLTVGQWLAIEERYQRRKRGIRNVIGEHIRETSSTAPNRLGEVLSTIGVKNWTKELDQARNVAYGDSVSVLNKITERRNRIAHSSDKKGRGRALADLEEIQSQVQAIEDIVNGLEKVLSKHQV